LQGSGAFTPPSDYAETGLPRICIGKSYGINGLAKDGEIAILRIPLRNSAPEGISEKIIYALDESEDPIALPSKRFQQL